jgi:hypothetical protein
VLPAIATPLTGAPFHALSLAIEATVDPVSPMVKPMIDALALAVEAPIDTLASAV